MIISEELYLEITFADGVWWATQQPEGNRNKGIPHDAIGQPENQTDGVHGVCMSRLAISAYINLRQRQVTKQALASRL